MIILEILKALLFMSLWGFLQWNFIKYMWQYGDRNKLIKWLEE